MAPQPSNKHANRADPEEQSLGRIMIPAENNQHSSSKAAGRAQPPLDIRHIPKYLLSRINRALQKTREGRNSNHDDALDHGGVRDEQGSTASATASSGNSSSNNIQAPPAFEEQSEVGRPTWLSRHHLRREGSANGGANYLLGKSLARFSRPCDFRCTSCPCHLHQSRRHVVRLVRGRVGLKNMPHFSGSSSSSSDALRVSITALNSRCRELFPSTSSSLLPDSSRRTT